MTVADLTYAYQVAPWSSPLSMGVQAFIEFNGYVINDRHQADRIRVTSITGLDGPDVTDVREVVPGDIGEFAYETLQRGQTFLLSGQIQAGSLGTLMAMESELKAAYALGTESPLIFRWFDVYDSFDDSQTLDNYTAVVGSSYLTDLTVSGGVLLWGAPNGDTVYLMRTADNRLWGDNQTSLRVIYGPPNDGSAVKLLLSYVDTSDYAAVVLTNSATPALTVQTVVGGTAYTLATVNVPGLVQGQSVWLRGKREGDLLTAEVWLTPPSENSLPDYSASAWLAGSDSDAYGDQVLSQVGFGMTSQSQGLWALDDFQISSLCPCDVSVLAKSISKPSIVEQQQSRTQYTRNFQLTLRASQPWARCVTQSRSVTLVPSDGNTTQLGFSAPLVNPLAASAYATGTISLTNNLLSFNNRGDAPDRGQIVFYGAGTNIVLYNLTNGQQITWTGELADGDYLIFDCAARTLVNSIGANMMAYFSSTDPRWMVFEPGWNDIFVGGSGYSANTKVLAYYHSRFS